MFRRVTNIDLLNKIIELENKIDNISIKFVCKEKFEDMLKDLKEIKSKNESSEKELNVFTEQITNLYNLIKTDNNLNKILEKSDNNLYKILKESDNNVIKINKILEEVNKTIKDIYNKIDLLYYENETIKHQFLLEEDIRKYENEIDNLKNIIKTTIFEIDKILIIKKK